MNKLESKEKIKEELQFLYQEGRKAEGIGIHTNKLARAILNDLNRIIKRIG